MTGQLPQTLERPTMGIRQPERTVAGDRVVSIDSVAGGFTTGYGLFLPIMTFSAIVLPGMYAGQWLNSTHISTSDGPYLHASDGRIVEITWPRTAPN